MVSVLRMLAASVLWADLSAATDPTMTLHIRVGDDANEITDTWEQKSYGWLRFHN